MFTSKSKHGVIVGFWCYFISKSFIEGLYNKVDMNMT